MTKRKLPVLAVLILMVGLAGCPKDKPQAAAGYVQRYAVSLEAFQNAEIKAHDTGFVTPELHNDFQNDFIKAAQAGEDLDKGIVIASNGGSPKEYIDAAYTTSDALITDLNLIKDEKKRAELQLLFKASRDVLNTGISIFLK
jgi:hypothetical protein